MQRGRFPVGFAAGGRVGETCVRIGTGSLLTQLTPTRFVAAMVVVLFHLGGGVPALAQPWLSALLRNGPLAVTWFFTLSGFVMATVHGDLRMSGVAGYWRARLARIYPLYILALAIEGWVLGASPLQQKLNWLLGATLLQAWVPGHAQSLNSPGWSLSVEILFYAAFPALIAMARRVGLAAWCGLAVALWAVSQAGYLLALNRLPIAYPSRAHDALHYLPPAHLGSFVVGMAAALLLRRLRPRPAVGAALLLTGLAASALAMLDAPAAAAGRGLVLDFGNGLLAPGFGLILIGLAATPLPALRWRPLVLLGEASYAVYLFQFPCYSLWLTYVSRHLGLSPGHDLAGFAALLTAASLAMHFAVERPCRAWLRGAPIRRQPAAVADPAPRP